VNRSTSIAAAVVSTLLVVTVPAGLAAGEPEVEPVAVASASAPTPTATTPGPVDEEDGPSLDVEGGTSLSHLRHLGVDVTGADLPPGTTASLRLDGTVVREVTTTRDGTLEGVHVRFPSVAVGEHTLALVSGSGTLASLQLDAQEDVFDVTVAPGWVTAETLRTSGVRLRIGPQHRSETADQDFDAFVVHRAADGAVEEVPLGRATRRGDGSVQATVRGGATEFPTSTSSVCLRSDFLGFLVSCAELRLTDLGIARSDDGRTVTGTGFEPGSEVTLLVDGEVVTVTTARDDTSVRVPLTALPLDTITLRSAAGEATLAVDPLPEPTRDLARTLKDKAALVATIESASQVLTSAVGPDSVGKPFTSAQTAALTAQVEAQEKLLGPYPARPLEAGKGSAYTPGPGLAGAGPGDWRTSAGSLVHYDVRGAEAAREKEVDAEADELAARAEELEKADRLGQYVQDSLRDMMDSTLRFLKELTDARASELRSITRASTPTVVARQSVGADTVVSVAIPPDFRGRHHIAVIDPRTGLVLAWQPVDVVADASAPTGGGTGDTARAGAGSTLPAAGADVGLQLLPVGLVLVLLGTALTVLGRRRRA
jgi:hypothetical protein